MRIFPDETSILICWLSEVDYTFQCRWPSLSPLRAWMEQNVEWGRIHFLSICLLNSPALGLGFTLSAQLFSGFQAWTGTTPPSFLGLQLADADWLWFWTLANTSVYTLSELKRQTPNEVKLSSSILKLRVSEVYCLEALKIWMFS